MSSNKENAENDKKKKSRPRLSIKIFSSNNKKKDNLKKIHEEFHSLDGSYKTQNDAERQTEEAGDVPKEKHSLDGFNKNEKQTEKVGDATKEETDSDTSEDSIEVVPRPPTFRPGRRRSLSACADVQDTRIKIRSKDEEEEEEEKDGEDQLSPLPCCSPTKSCLRARSATFGYAGENVESVSRPRSVSFSPDTVDPPPRNLKYRAWIEARSKPPPVNVKHEKHKQKMNQLKKVNMSDYLASRKMTSGTGIMASSSSAFGGGSMMM